MIKRILSERFTVHNTDQRSSRQINFSCRFQAGKFVEHEVAGEYIKDAGQVYGQATDKATRAFLLLIAYEQYIAEQLGGNEPPIDEALPGFTKWLAKTGSRSGRSGGRR